MFVGIFGWNWKKIYFFGNSSTEVEDTVVQGSRNEYQSTTRVPLEVAAVTLLPKNYYSSSSTVVGSAREKKRMRQQRKTGNPQEWQDFALFNEK